MKICVKETRANFQVLFFLKATSWLRSVPEVVLCLAALTKLLQECKFDLQLKLENPAAF